MFQARRKSAGLPASLLAIGFIAVFIGRSAMRPSAPALTGRIEPSLTLVSTPSGGTVRDVFVREGESVRKGQILARFETKDLESRQAELRSSLRAIQAAKGNQKALNVLPSDLRNALRDAHPEVVKAEEAYVRALAEFDRAAPDDRPGAQVRLDGAAHSRMSTRSRVQTLMSQGSLDGEHAAGALAARLTEINRFIAAADVHSPVDGVVELFNLKPGDSLLPTAPVGAIAEVHKFYSDVIVEKAPLSRACKAILEDSRVLNCEVESTFIRTVPPMLREARAKSQEVVTRVTILTSERIQPGTMARFELL